MFISIKGGETIKDHHSGPCVHSCPIKSSNSFSKQQIPFLLLVSDYVYVCIMKLDRQLGGLGGNKFCLG